MFFFNFLLFLSMHISLCSKGLRNSRRRFSDFTSRSQSPSSGQCIYFGEVTSRDIFQCLLEKDPPHVSYYAPAIQFLTGRSLLKLGQQVHAHMTIRGHAPDSFVGAKMVAMYASSDDLDSATSVFHQVTNRSSLLFNSIIRAYALYGLSEKTIAMYMWMHSLGLKGDNFTYPFVLKACAELLNCWVGKCVHGQSSKSGLEFDVYVGTSLIDMYVKCGEVSDAHNLFDIMEVRDVSSWNALIAGYVKNGEILVAEDLFCRMPCRNIVSWTAMISGYAQNGLSEQALHLFDEMLKEDSEVKPNWVTIVSVLPACAHSAKLEHGRRIHDYARRIGADSNSSVQSALVAMYAKCGSLAGAKHCFDRIHHNAKNLVAWNSMIAAYAYHGCGAETVSTFEEIIRNGTQPDCVTFTGLLSGCSHSGLVDLGLRLFYAMKSIYSVDPKHEHYACVVDLLSRAGRLVEAKEVINRMPLEAGPSIWGALLAACRSHRNLEIAEIAAQKLFEQEPDNSGNYVLLSNLYAELGLWKEVDKMRDLLKVQGMKKSPGCSWIEFHGKTYLFLGGDTSHPQSKEIQMFLETLPQKMKAAGYVPNTSFVFHDVSEEEKEHNLVLHSEKLAIAFGILNTSPEVELRVTKNLRICGDCHMAIKFISKIYAREIIVRDLKRFHHFKDGICTCGDYW